MKRPETLDLITKEPLITTGKIRPLEIFVRQILISTIKGYDYYPSHGPDRPLYFYQAQPNEIEVEYRRTFSTAQESTIMQPFRSLYILKSGRSLSVRSDDITEKPHISVTAHFEEGVSWADSYLDEHRTESVELIGPSVDQYALELQSQVDAFEIIVDPYKTAL